MPSGADRGRSAPKETHGWRTELGARSTRGRTARTRYARVQIAGRPHYKGGFQSKSSARLWIDGEVAKAERAEVLGFEPIRGEVTIRGILPRWLASIRPRLSDRAYETLATKILIPYFRETPVSAIRSRDVDRFLADKAKAGKAAGTLNRYLSCLSRICRFAVEAGYARQNPTRGVKRAREEPLSFVYLQREDEARLLAAMPDWLRTPSLVALDAGLRLARSEP